MSKPIYKKGLHVQDSPFTVDEFNNMLIEMYEQRKAAAQTKPKSAVSGKAVTVKITKDNHR